MKKIMKHSVPILLCTIALFAAVSCSKEQSETYVECTHQYSNWSITKNFTCVSEGIQSRTCQKCGYMDMQSMAALGHTEVVSKTGKDATCTESGLTEQRTCSVCNTILSNQTVLPAKGHTKVVDEAGKNATCVDAGWTESSHCSTCNIVFSEKKTLKATGHVEKTDLAKPATCTQTGLTEGKHCSVCNHVLENQKSIPATGHTVVTDKAVTATCTSTGLTQGSHCSTCNTILTKQTTIAKLSSHTYVSGVCKHCDKNDPNYAPIYNAGETWTVDGQWEISFDNAIQTVIKDGKQTIQLTWRYKNIGYSEKLNISMWDYDLYDSEMELNTKWTLYDVSYNNQTGVDCIVGAKATCSVGWILNNNSSTVKVYLELEDSNKQTHKAYFVLDVVLPEEEPEEDKLNGCTFTLGTSLPQTISYYTSSDKLQSSCTVTEVAFEVSGDDLYVYFTGRKTYDSRGSGQSDSCKIGWKLYDNNNNVIAAGTEYTLSLATGEGFVKSAATAYDCIKPEGTYKLVLLNVN